MELDSRRATPDEAAETAESAPSRVARLLANLRPRHMLAALFLAVGLALVLPPLIQAQENTNRAGLVIQHGDGRVVTACISFAEPEISGLDLLNRAGVGYLAQSGGNGAALCQIDGEGCDYPTEDCFCKCKGADCAYWSYQRLREGRWVYSQLGAAAVRVKNGDIDGWAWGAGNVQSGAQPPVLTLDQICQASAAQVPTEAPPALTEPPPSPPTDVPPVPTELPPAPPTRPPRPTAPPQPTIVVPTPTIEPPSAPTALPTNAATAAPTEAPTLQPTAPPTRLAPTNMPTALVAGAAPTPTANAPKTSGSTLNYALFGVLVLALGGGIVAVLLRRRSGS